MSRARLPPCLLRPRVRTKPRVHLIPAVTRAPWVRDHLVVPAWVSWLRLRTVPQSQRALQILCHLAVTAWLQAPLMLTLHLNLLPPREI